MAAERDPRDLRDERGQSILEFLFMLPVLVGITVLLIRINTAIQVSIVNQQYARMQTLFLNQNSAVYPSLSLRQRAFQDGKFSQMVVGVSENALKNDESNSNQIEPEATTKNIVGKNGIQGSSDPKTEPPRRSDVRIRGTVTLCTQTNFVRSQDGALSPILPLSGRSENPRAIGPNNLKEGVKLEFCAAPQMEYL